MTIITRTVNSLIEDAYKLIGLFSEDMSLSGGRITEGLQVLQLILDEFASKPTKIAWDQTVTFNMVIGQNEYTFSKDAGADVNSNRLVSLKFVNVKDVDSVYPVEIQPDEYYLGRYLSTTNTSRPSEVYLQNFLDTTNDYEGSKLVFFTNPDKTYEVSVKGKFVLSVIALNQPLDEVPLYYHRFIKYALGRALQDVYPGSTWNEKLERTYLDLLENIQGATDLDLISDTGAALKGNNRGYTKGRFMSGC